jgi:hypothetical protein
VAITHGLSAQRVPPAGAPLLTGVAAWWVVLGVAAVVEGSWLNQVWPAWRWAFGAAAVWGANAALLVYGISPPLRVSRPPVLAAGFALLMTVLGSGSYWATVQLYPLYRVGIERAAWFVAVCTMIALGAAAVTKRIFGRSEHRPRAALRWDWSRLGAMTYVVFAVAAIGTFVAIRRIGYIPILAGDPTSARVDFPAIGGIWYRLSMLGGVVALLVAAQGAARRATVPVYLIGFASLCMVGLYGPRFFVALPLAVSLLLWDKFRAAISIRRVVLFALVAAPLLAVVGHWRERDESATLLSPLGVLLYGALGEFRDIGWALDYYSLGDRFLHGTTLGSLVVPLLPSPVWSLVGIDKAAIYSQNSASLLADAMGQTTGQRIGAYGEFFMNFGWAGAVIGALLYGVLLGYLDDRFRRVDSGQVWGVFLALAIATTVFAQVGQLNMFTSTLTGFGYPMALVALVAARRSGAITSS